MKLELRHVERASTAILSVLVEQDRSCCLNPPTDYRLCLEKTRRAVLFVMDQWTEANGERMEDARSDAAFLLALAYLHREGYVEISLPDASGRRTIGFTDEGSERCFFGELPVFAEGDLGAFFEQTPPPAGEPASNRRRTEPGAMT